MNLSILTYYSGAPTYLVSPVDFAQNPLTLFVTLARYKIKDTYATSQMLDYAMSAMAGKGFQLQELKNLMISAEGRPRTDLCMYLHYQSHEDKLTQLHRWKGTFTFRQCQLGPYLDQCHLLARSQPDGDHTIIHVH